MTIERVENGIGMNRNKALTTGELMQETGLSRQLISQMIHKGLLDAELIAPRLYLITRKSADRYIAKRAARLAAREEKARQSLTDKGNCA